MEQAFDAYHKWLGIPPECQPPDHYRLLGLQTFESDPDVVQAAADQRMMHLRAYQTGKNSEWSQRLLNEVAAAKVCLLNAAKKAAYDQKLRAALGSGPPKVQTPPTAEPSNPAMSFVPDVLENRRRLRVSAYARRAKRLPLGPFIIGLASVAALLIVVLVYRALQNVESPTVKSWQADSPPYQAGTHDTATNKPKNAQGETPSVTDTKTGTVSKVGKASQVDHPSSTKSPAPKESSPKERSHPGLWDPPGSVTRNPGIDANKSPDDTLPTPFELPLKHPKTGKAADGSNRKDQKTPRAKPSDEEQPSSSSDDRAVEPPVEVQEEAMKVARDLYKDELVKARTPEEKQALAKKMLDQAEAAANADVGTFALFRLARDTVAQALDGLSAFAVVDAMAERYQIDVVKMKMELLSTFAKKARVPPQHLSVAEQAARLMIEAQANEDFYRAADLARMASTEGALAHDKELVTLAKACLKECQQAAAVVAQFNAAQPTLVRAPDDPSANLAVGTYYSGLKNDWKKGLPFLAKGDDPDLKVLAERELKSPPNSVEEQVALADAWWDAGQGAEGTKKGAMIHRSEYWCKKAKSEQVGGPNAAMVERRLAEIAKIERETPAAVLAARPSLPINKWFPLLTSPNELTGWVTAGCHFSYAKGVIELRDGEMFCPIVAKDVTIRAKVNCPTTGNVCLFIRNGKQGCYAARIKSGVLSIVKYKTIAATVDRSATVVEDVLVKTPVPRNKRGVRVLDFDFGFSAVGDSLTAFANGRPVLQAKDAAFSEGAVGIGTSQTDNLYFADVAMQIPNKASFVADRRSPAVKKPAAAKTPLIPNR